MTASRARERPSVAVVPIRGGSKGLPGKNVRRLAGRPLYRHAIEHARGAGMRTTVITTDIVDVLSADLGDGVIVHRRPTKLCGDDVPMAPVLTDVLSRPEFDGDPVVVLLQATTPLRRAAHISAAVADYLASDADLLLSVCQADRGVLKYGTVDGDRFVPLRSASDTFSNRQQLPDVYRPNGAIYVFGADWYRSRGDLASESIAAFVMSVEDSVDIDTLGDFEQVEQILRVRQREQE